MSDTYYETTDTAETDTHDTWNHYTQDDPPEAGNDWNDTGPETSYYDQDYAPETSDYYDQDYGHQETLDETRARIATQDSAEEQPGTARGSQSELTTAGDNPAPAEASDLTATHESTEPANSRNPDESSPASPPDRSPLPADSGQGSDLEANDLRRQQDAAQGSTDTHLDNDEAPGAPARHDSPDQAAGEHTRNDSPDIPGQDTANNADEPHSPQDAAPSPPGPYQSGGDAGTSTTDNANANTQHDQPDSTTPHGPDASPETDDRIKALLVQLDQTRAELDGTRAERDQAIAERDQATAELDQANREIADLKTGSQEQPAHTEDLVQRSDGGLDATDTSQPERYAEQPPTDAGRDTADAREPEQVTEDADRSRAQNAPLVENEATDHEDDTKEAKRSKARVRDVASPDNIAIGAAMWDAQDAVQKVLAHAMHDAVSPSVAVAIGVAGVAVSKIQERRKEKRK